ncbi:response regulator transcription factor [Candidatus Magnetominusculus xianensis]|uniref:DNA-binding response regulator n=1 Tax=Candidatus Magnetominusculus xianensis TaxID=1748249 RepID=A0ABR5SBF1_9BACT|nr:response regulator transcription factor [Candidatus Magnetominusculus xianensis]KWT76404.1 DNA-binding response regulator [Candidatus Magnetominusculus xianensis]MBF0404872.1 response regulator transcription factor [Nitrospirota bacterium]
MIRPILVVEDERKIARVIKVYLEEAGFSVVHVERGKDAMEFASKEVPALVILDLMLPDINGEEVLQEMKDMGEFPVIVLTAKSSPEERVAGFALGADDYIVKPFNPREMVYRVKAVLRRAPEVSDTPVISFNKGSLIVDNHRYEVKKNGVSVNLTPTEFKVFSTLACAAHKVFTREVLIEKAFGYEFEGYDRSIDVHIKNIRQKIEDDPRTPVFILTVYKVGYKFIGERDA